MTHLSLALKKFLVQYLTGHSLIYAGNRKISTAVIIAIVAPISVTIVVFLILCCLLRRRAAKKHGVMQDEGGKPYGNQSFVHYTLDIFLLLSVDGDCFLFCSVGNDFTTPESLQFDFATVQAATDNFSADNKLGEGGFGEVYKV